MDQQPKQNEVTSIGHTHKRAIYNNTQDCMLLGHLLAINNAIKNNNLQTHYSFVYCIYFTVSYFIFM